MGYGARLILPIKGMNMAAQPLLPRTPHSGEKLIWLHDPCLLTVPIVGRNQYFHRDTWGFFPTKKL